MRGLKPGTPLRTLPGRVLDESGRRQLRRLSVTTVEEFVGLLDADPHCCGRILEVDDLASLRSAVLSNAGANVIVANRVPPAVVRPLGALDPSGGEPPVAVPTEDDGVPDDDPEGQFPSTIQRDLRDKFGPIKNQSRRSTCVAFACAALAESLDPNRPNLSEQFLYWAAKQSDGKPQEPGTLIRVAMQSLQQLGICDQLTWPYKTFIKPGNEGQGPPPATAIPDALLHRLSAPRALTDPKSVAEIKETLDSGQAVALSIPTFDSWYNNPHVQSWGQFPLPPQGSVARQLGHAMCLVGYLSDNDFAGGGGFIVRNSWGTGWAARSTIAPGYGILPYRYVQLYAWEAATVA